LKAHTTPPAPSLFAVFWNRLSGYSSLPVEETTHRTAAVGQLTSCRFCLII
jgi:hypothetical protein